MRATACASPVRAKAAARVDLPEIFICGQDRRDKNFQRQENDLLCQLPISFSQAALGDQISVKTFEEVEKLKSRRRRKTVR